jgi:hypothetical protein
MERNVMHRKFIVFILVFVALFAFECIANADISEHAIDPEVDCAEYLSPKTVDEVKEILSNPSGYATYKEDKMIICLDMLILYLSNGNSITIINDSSDPLIIYGLMLAMGGSFDGVPGLTISDNNIILQGTWFVAPFNQIYDSCFAEGIRINGSSNAIVNGEVRGGFCPAVTVNGSHNVLKNTNIESTNGIVITGYNNRVENVGVTRPVDIADFTGIEVSGTNHTITSSSVSNFGKAFDVGCNWDFAAQPKRESACVIGPDNTIINSDYAVYAKQEASNLTVTQNNVLNYHDLIYYEGEMDFELEPFITNEIGIANFGSVDNDGGYHIIGKLKRRRGIDTQKDRVELFSSSEGELSFTTECEVVYHVGVPIKLANMSGNVVHFVKDGDFIYDCGILEVEDDQVFRFTYIDSKGNTSLYSEPVTPLDSTGFNPAVNCLGHTVISKYSNKIKEVLENFELHAEEEENRWVMCFDESEVYQLNDSHIRIDNNTGKELVIYGLRMQKNLDSSFWEGADKNESAIALILAGQKIKLLNAKIKYEGESVGQERVGVVLEGHGHEVLYSEVSDFDTCIEMSGYDHQVENTSFIACDVGVRVGCAWPYDSTNRPSCVVGPNNTIVGSSYGVYVEKKASNITVTQNNIPTDQNQHLIYYEDKTNFELGPFNIGEVGIANIKSVDVDGGYHIVGKLIDIKDTDIQKGTVEVFFSDKEDASFIANCSIIKHSAQPVELFNMDGKAIYEIKENSYIYDCGVLNLNSFTMFNFTYTDLASNTYPYSDSMSLKFKNEKFDPTIPCSSASPLPFLMFGKPIKIQELLENFQIYGTEYEDVWLLCFDYSYENESIKAFMSFEAGDSMISVHNDTGKKLIIYGLNIELHNNYYSNDDRELGNYGAFLEISGSDVQLVDSHIKYIGSDNSGLTGVRLKGSGHKVENSKIEGFDTCAELKGYGHQVSDSEISKCNTGVYVDCAGVAGLFVETAPSCFIGTDNLFENIWNYSVYMPTSAQQVTVSQNKLENVASYIFQSEGANNNIEVIDTREVGLKVSELSPGSESLPLLVGKLDNSVCEEKHVIEMYTKTYLMNIHYFGECEIGFLDDDSDNIITNPGDEKGYIDKNVFFTIMPGDCIFWCNNVFLNESTYFTLTDWLGNTSELSGWLIKAVLPDIIGAANPSPSVGSDARYGEENDDFLNSGSSESEESDDDDTVISDTGEDDPFIDGGPLSSLSTNIVHPGCSLSGGNRYNAQTLILIFLLLSAISIKRRISKR